MTSGKDVYVFKGVKAAHPGGVFETLNQAEEAIRTHRLTGMLTRYPVGLLAYDWAVERGFFSADKKMSSDFVGGFTSGSMEHYHYEEGKRS